MVSPLFHFVQCDTFSLNFSHRCVLFLSLNSVDGTAGGLSCKFGLSILEQFVVVSPFLILFIIPVNDASSSASKVSPKKKEEEFFVAKSLILGKEKYYMAPHPKYLDFFRHLKGQNSLMESCIDLLKVQLLASCIQYENSTYYHDETIQLSSEEIDEEELATEIASGVLEGMDVDLKKFMPIDQDEMDIECFILRFHHPEFGTFYVQFSSVYGCVYRQNYFIIKEGDMLKVGSLISRVGEHLLPCLEHQKKNIHHNKFRHDPIDLRTGVDLKEQLGISEEQFNQLDKSYQEIAVLIFLIARLQENDKAVPTPSNLHCIEYVQLFQLVLKHREKEDSLVFMIMDVLTNLHQNSNACVVYSNRVIDSETGYFQGKGKSKNPKQPLQDAYDSSRLKIQHILDAGGDLYDKMKHKEVTQCKPKTLGYLCIMTEGINKRKQPSDGNSIGVDSQEHIAKKQKTEGVILMQFSPDLIFSHIPEFFV
jgi:hypothetical protein